MLKMRKLEAKQSEEVLEKLQDGELYIPTHSW